MRSSTAISILAALALGAPLGCTDIEGPKAEEAPDEQAASPLAAQVPFPEAPGWRVLAAAKDLNHDGISDVVWNDYDKNLLCVWLMNDTALLSAGPVLPGPPGVGWRAIATGDLNFDGLADVVWQNEIENQMTVWLMNGTTVLAEGPVIPGPPGDSWRMSRNADDLNFDRMEDILWSNTRTGVMTAWLMNGTTVLARGPEIPGPPGDGWVAINPGDFNHDGMGDVLWTNAEKNLVSVWLMNGTTVLAQGPLIPGPPGGGSTVSGAGDLNFDGMSDLVWDNVKKRGSSVWLMASTSALARGPQFFGPPGDGWFVGSTGEFIFDGMVDVVWQGVNPPRLVVYLMQGTAILAVGPTVYSPLP